MNRIIIAFMIACMLGACADYADDPSQVIEQQSTNRNEIYDNGYGIVGFKPIK